VNIFIDGLKKCGIDVFDLLKDVQVVCMGQHTKDHVERVGLVTAGMPASPTREALVEYLIQCPIV
jgi:uroporphyrinogen-III synthase